MAVFAEIKKTFLSAPKYAVVGASKDQTKFGTKVRAAADQLFKRHLTDLSFRC